MRVCLQDFLELFLILIMYVHISHSLFDIMVDVQTDRLRLNTVSGMELLSKS